jgi:hypothetical protein
MIEDIGDSIQSPETGPIQVSMETDDPSMDIQRLQAALTMIPSQACGDDTDDTSAQGLPWTSNVPTADDLVRQDSPVGLHPSRGGSSSSQGGELTPRTDPPATEPSSLYRFRGRHGDHKISSRRSTIQAATSNNTHSGAHSNSAAPFVEVRVSHMVTNLIGVVNIAVGDSLLSEGCYSLIIRMIIDLCFFL